MKPILLKRTLLLCLLHGALLTSQAQKNNPTDSLKKQIDSLKKANDSLASSGQGYAVAPFGDTLFRIYFRLGSFSAKERAAAVSQRIQKLADDYFFQPDSLLRSPSELSVDIAYKENIIISISDKDAGWMHSSPDSLAARYRESIIQSVEKQKQAASFRTRLKEIGQAILVILLLIGIIYGISRLFRLTRNKIIRQKDRKVRGVRIRNYLLFDASQETSFLILLNSILKWVLILVIIYLALPVLFGIFPWTKGFATTLLDYFLDPIRKIARSVWNYLPNLITILVILLVFRYLLRAVRYLRNEVQRGALKIPGFYAEWANPTYQIVRVLALAFMLIVIFPYLPGSESPVFKGVSVFLGVLFTFGSAGALSNIVAGLVLTYMRAYNTGDRVRIGEVTGDIVERSLLVTRIRTIKNEIVSIPNSTVISNHTTNFSSDAPDKGLIIHTTVTIGYDAPWRKVHQLLTDAALATEMIEKEPAPFVLQTGLQDFSVSYQINAYTREPGMQAEIYSHLHQNIQDKFNEAGVEIMSPIYNAVRDGNTVTIPPDHLPKDYTAPPFNVRNTAH